MHSAGLTLNMEMKVPISRFGRAGSSARGKIRLDAEYRGPEVGLGGCAAASGGPGQGPADSDLTGTGSALAVGQRPLALAVA